MEILYKPFKFFLWFRVNSNANPTGCYIELIIGNILCLAKDWSFKSVLSLTTLFPVSQKIPFTLSNGTLQVKPLPFILNFLSLSGN